MASGAGSEGRAGGRRRKELAIYLRAHQSRLEQIAQRCVNRVLLERPLDPYEALLHHLSEHTQEGISLSHLRFFLYGTDAVTCEAVADVRGAAVAALRGRLPRTLAAAALGNEAEAPEDTVAKLRKALGSALQGAKILDFAQLEKRLRAAVPGEGEAVHAFRVLVAGFLLETAGCLLNGSGVQAARSGLLLRRLEPGPPIICQEDLEVWQPRWPELLLPAVAAGGAPRRCLCVGVKLWAALLPDLPTAAGVRPVFVDEVARDLRRLAQAEAEANDVIVEDPDEVPPPEPDEQCPPTNAVAAVLALAAAVAARAATGGEPPGDPPAAPARGKAPPAPLPEILIEGDNFGPALQGLRRALETLLPGYFEESQEVRLVSLEEQQWRGSFYGALWLDADAAFNPKSGTYSFGEGSPSRTQAELVEHLAALCCAEPLLKMLVSPVSPRDEGSLAALRSRLPQEVLIISEPPPRGVAPRQTVVRTAGEDDKSQKQVDSGHFRDLSLSPMGLLANCELHPALYAGTCGFYDFSGISRPAPLVMLVPFLEASVALPEERRCLALPKGTGGQELSPPLRALDTRVAQLVRTAYSEKAATDGREKLRNVNRKQWREGLRRLGYQDVEEYAEPLFHFLDSSKNGSISRSELVVMQDVRGPASLQELDEFRIWLCAWQGTARGSPLTELWRLMDANRSGSCSFGEFKRALRIMKHPAAMEGRDGALQELFMCLDLRSRGSVDEADFYCLAVFSAKFQLDRVLRVRDFLQEKFGTSKAAFKAIDENRSGSLSKEEWMHAMGGKQSYPVLEDCVVCFQFFDKDGSGFLTTKEFEQLGAFDADTLLDTAFRLLEHLVEKCGSLEAAYDAFEPSPSAGLDAKDFLAGLKSTQFLGVVDPRLLFNFLDAVHVGRVGRTEFLQLARLGALDDLQERTELMQGAISSLKAFATRLFEDSPEGTEELWPRLHKELRNVTHGDFDLC